MSEQRTTRMNGRGGHALSSARMPPCAALWRAHSQATASRWWGYSRAHSCCDSTNSPPSQPAGGGSTQSASAGRGGDGGGEGAGAGSGSGAAAAAAATTGRESAGGAASSTRERASDNVSTTGRSGADTSSWD